MIKKVGVTGAIGSGKTTFCKILEELGAKVFFADDEAKRLMAQNVELKLQLVDAFGKNTYLPDGTLNKPHLIREAFEKGKVEKLNSIVHPAVSGEFKRFTKKAAEEGFSIVIKEAALLLNSGRPAELDVVIIITSDREKRVNRVIRRDNTSEKAILDRDSNQPDFDRLSHLADYVIENSGTIEELRYKAESLFESLIQ